MLIFVLPVIRANADSLACHRARYHIRHAQTKTHYTTLASIPSVPGVPTETLNPLPGVIPPAFPCCC